MPRGTSYCLCCQFMYRLHHSFCIFCCNHRCLYWACVWLFRFGLVHSLEIVEYCSSMFSISLSHVIEVCETLLCEEDCFGLSVGCLIVNFLTSPNSGYKHRTRNRCQHEWSSLLSTTMDLDLMNTSEKPLNYHWFWAFVISWIRSFQ